MAVRETAQAAREMWRKMARGVGIVALVFSLVVGVLLVVDGLQGGQTASVLSPVLAQVQARARVAATDREAVAMARDMDRLARHAYFSHVAFRRTGIWLLVVGVLVSLGCWHLAVRWGCPIENPRLFTGDDARGRNAGMRWALLLTGAGGLLVLAVWAISQPLTKPTGSRAGDVPGGMVAGGATNGAGVPAGDVSARTVPGACTSQWCVFRGPRLGVAWMTNAPVAWDGARGVGVRWRVPLEKPGVSSPVLWGETLFLTEADDQRREVLAFDTQSGLARWRRTVVDGGRGVDLPQTTADTGLAAASPACDATAVYAVFGSGDLVAYSHAGTLLWQCYLRRPANDYGHASSLWVEDGLVCVQYDQKEESRLLVVAAANGKVVWEKARSRGPSWSSPVGLTANGSRLLVLNGHGQLDAYDLRNGQERWSVEGVTGEVAPSPAWWNGRLLVANAYARLVCYPLSAIATPAWEYTEVLPDVASPVADNGLVFLATSDGRLVCVDVADGKAVWSHEYANGFYASPIVCGTRVYALDREGIMRVVAAERTFREIASCPLGESADATPAFADGQIYIRTKKALWGLGAK